MSQQEYLNSFSVPEFDLEDGTKIKIMPPLRVGVWRVHGGDWMAYAPIFDIDMTNSTYEGLVKDVIEWLKMLWEEYVRCDTDKLTDSGKAMKLELLQRMQEVKI